MLDFGFYNMDCMDGMKEFPDQFFDLAIVDPPYGINVGQSAMGAGGRRSSQKQISSEFALRAEETRRTSRMGGGTVRSEARSRSATIQVGGVHASVPKFTRRSMTATHRTPHISKSYKEWQRR